MNHYHSHPLTGWVADIEQATFQQYVNSEAKVTSATSSATPTRMPPVAYKPDLERPGAGKDEGTTGRTLACYRRAIVGTICGAMATYVVLALLLSLIGACPGIAQAQSVGPTGGSFTLSARWSQYLHRTFGRTRLALLAAETAVDHGFGEPACWDASAGAYAQRYARVFDRRLIRNTTELVTGILTGEDLRYRKSRSHSIRGRAWNAFRASVVAEMPDGTQRPAYSRFFASATTELSTAHWTGQPIRAPWVFQSLGWSALDQVETNLLDEFSPDIRRIGKSLWHAACNRADHHRRP